MPEPLPLVDEPGGDILNFLLLGSDTTNPRNAGRTDVIMIVSVNRVVGSVAMLSIPRDLYVYIPDWGMQRINVAFGRGENDEDPDTSGASVLEATIAHNLGIPIDYFARVDFAGFRELIDSLGGVEISVDCAIEDWRLSAPELDPTLEENWELYTLPVGLHTLDGDLALWYVRSRRTSSDFDRGRRQQAVLRAVWQRARNLNLLQQIADLWPQINEIVRTDVDVRDLAALAPLSMTIDASRVTSYTFRLNQEVTAWQSPDGASMLLPVREAVLALSAAMMVPPTENQLRREGARVEVVNASGIANYDRVAADRLALEGFRVTVSRERAAYQYATTIEDFTGQSKGTSLAALQGLLRTGAGETSVVPTADRAIDFRVYVGESYRSCTYGVLPPSSLQALSDN